MRGGFDAATGATGDWRAGYVSFAARSGHRHGSCAGEAGADDRLGISGREIRRGLQGWRRPAAVADAADGGARHSQTHLQPQRRGGVREVGREPLLPILLRRVELLPPAAVRSIIDDALAPAARRGAARRADPGKSVGGAQDWRHRSQGPGASGGRYHGAAKGRCASDRRAADASGHHQARRVRQSSAIRRAHLPDLLDKKSRSTVNCPILAWSFSTSSSWAASPSRPAPASNARTA